MLTAPSGGGIPKRPVVHRPAPKPVVHHAVLTADVRRAAPKRPAPKRTPRRSIPAKKGGTIVKSVGQLPWPTVTPRSSNPFIGNKPTNTNNFPGGYAAWASGGWQRDYAHLFGRMPAGAPAITPSKPKPTAPPAPSSPVQAIYNSLRQSGLNPAQSAGVLGNIQNETNPNARGLVGAIENTSGDAGSSWGLIQWHLPGLRSTFVQQEGTQPVTGNVQKDYANQISAIVKTFRTQKIQGTTAGQVAGNWAAQVEQCQGCQPGGGQWQQRVANATAIFATSIAQNWEGKIGGSVKPVMGHVSFPAPSLPSHLQGSGPVLGTPIAGGGGTGSEPHPPIKGLKLPKLILPGPKITPIKKKKTVPPPQTYPIPGGTSTTGTTGQIKSKTVNLPANLGSGGAISNVPSSGSSTTTWLLVGGAALVLVLVLMHGKGKKGKGKRGGVSKARKS